MFGARGTGKTTFLRSEFWAAHYVDLLEDKTETRYRRDPDLLASDIAAMTVAPEFVVIDEVQKLPKLLDVVHRLDGKQKFILTGSSARKLRRGKGNLLAGRAFANYLFPLTARELGDVFALADALRWGTYPPRCR